MNFHMCAINLIEKVNNEWHLKMATKEHLPVTEDKLRFKLNSHGLNIY